MRLAIAVPTYNEVSNLGPLVDAIRGGMTRAGIDCTLLVVDDSSPDGTGELADRMAVSESVPGFTMRVLHRTEKDGFGRAYVAAFRDLLAQNFTHILQMDADLSHDPRHILAMVAAADGADLVVGSRYISGGGTPDWGLGRRLLSRFGNIYTRIFLGSRIHDYTGGFNLFSTELLRELDVLSLRAGGYGFLIELKYRALRCCRTVREVPIIFMDREMGTSKMPKTTILHNLILVPRIRMSRQPGPSRRSVEPAAGWPVEGGIDVTGRSRRGGDAELTGTSPRQPTEIPRPASLR